MKLQTIRLLGGLLTVLTTATTLAASDKGSIDFTFSKEAEVVINYIDKDFESLSVVGLPPQSDISVVILRFPLVDSDSVAFATKDFTTTDKGALRANVFSLLDTTTSVPRKKLTQPYLQNDLSNSKLRGIAKIYLMQNPEAQSSTPIVAGVIRINRVYQSRSELDTRAPGLMDHFFSFLDQKTIDAIDRAIDFDAKTTYPDASKEDTAGYAFLHKEFGFIRRNTNGNGIQQWTGRYITGLNSQIEFFGPKDHVTAPPSMGFGIGLIIEKIGGLADTAAVLASRSQPYSLPYTYSCWNDSKNKPSSCTLEPNVPANLASIWVTESIPEKSKDISRSSYYIKYYDANRYMHDVIGLHVTVPESTIKNFAEFLRINGWTMIKPYVYTLDEFVLTMSVGEKPLVSKIDFKLNRKKAGQKVYRIGTSVLEFSEHSPLATWTFR